jgi:hypothetical protein
VGVQKLLARNLRLERHQLVATLLETLDDLSHQATLDAIGLDPA